MTSIAVGNRRLLRLAKILDTADALHKKRGEPAYDQSTFLHDCGSPACAVGHWAAANPRRWITRSGSFPMEKRLMVALKKDPSGYASEDSKTDFALSTDEYAELFWAEGCGQAKTAKQAANYIRRFVKRRQVKK